MRDIVYFDLETQRSFSDVGGTQHRDKMGVSVAVTFSTRDNEYRIFGEDEMDALVERLCRADLVVGFNHLHFDYPVLQGYTVLDLESQTVNLDMLVDLEQRLGFRLKLDAVASATLGTGKTADGLDALKWWKQYKKTGESEWLLKIAEYCAYDVKVTRMVHEAGVGAGKLQFHDRAGALQEVEVDWS
jgi:DEAD/DEAH box helicase domain-containing protein